jgi:hypothetical protein
MSLGLTVMKVFGISRATVALSYLISAIRKVALTYILFILFGLLTRRNVGGETSLEETMMALGRYCHVLGLCVAYRRVQDWMIGFIDTLYIHLGTTGNTHSGIADLHTLQFTVAHTHTHTHTHTYSTFMPYMFRPHRSIFRQHTYLRNPPHRTYCP